MEENDDVIKEKANKIKEKLDTHCHAFFMISGTMMTLI